MAVTVSGGAEIGGVTFAGVVVEEEVGVAHLAAEVVTLVPTDGAVVSARTLFHVLLSSFPVQHNKNFLCVHRWGSCGGLLW